MADNKMGKLWSDKDATWEERTEKAGKAFSSLGDTLKKSAGSKASFNVPSFNTSFDNSPTEFSDERLKNVFGEDCSIIDDYANINAYLYDYTDEAQDELGERVDDKEHVGVMAQELANNDATKDSVERDDTGYLKIDTAQLVLSNTAAIGELSRKIKELEELIKGEH